MAKHANVAVCSWIAKSGPSKYFLSLYEVKRGTKKKTKIKGKNALFTATEVLNFFLKWSFYGEATNLPLSLFVFANLIERCKAIFVL